jgi:AcrR family transcriptional regulator
MRREDIPARYAFVDYISTMDEIMRSRGRRPGPSTTREAILAAARERFSAHGYERARLRDVAADAGVDVALVHYHFKSKEGLFAAALELPVSLPSVMADVLERGELDDFAARFLRRILDVWDDERMGSALVAMVRSAATHEAAAVALREFVRTELLDRIARRLGTPDAGVRSAVFGSQLVGLLMYRHVLRVEPLASMDPDAVVAAIAPGMQVHLTGAR